MEPDTSPEAIRADIQDTQARMSQTLDELGERLNPERLATDAVHAVAHDVRESVMRKPFILAAAVAGLAAIVLLIAWRLESRAH